MEYQEFLQTKQKRFTGDGIEVKESDINPILFDFQNKVTRWALKKGRAALFLDTGLGKTFCQLEWARLIGGKTLIIAPLSVARQTVREAKKIDLDVKYIRTADQINSHKIYITNYEMVDSFTSAKWDAIVLDESSILKSMDGKTRRKLITVFRNVPYRLACTATPAPNDQVELGNHAEFLGICKQTEMLAEFFINANKVVEKHYGNGIVIKEKQSNKKGTEWRLKNYAKNDFYRWLSSWAMSMKKPSDLGFSDDGFILPKLNIIPVFVPVDYKPDGRLFFGTLKGIQERGEVRRKTIMPKILKALEIILDSRGTLGVNLQNGLDKESDTGIQQEILPKELGVRKIQESCLVSCEQREDRSGGKEKISSQILYGEQIEIQENPGTARESERSQKKEVCIRQEIQGKHQKKSPTVAPYKSSSQKSPTSKTIQSDIGGIRSNNGETKSVVCNMRDKRKWEQENVSVCGSRPQYRESKGATLHELQPGDREIHGQSSVPDECDTIPQWVIWCGLNKEQDEFYKKLTENNLTISSVYGSLPSDKKQQRIEDWMDNKSSILLTKGKVCGYGLNLQCAHNMLFLGLNDSFELYYQCIRREWRYGQKNSVNVYIVLSNVERAIYENVLRKETIAKFLHDELMKNIANYEKEELDGVKIMEIEHDLKTYQGETFTAMLGDSCERLRELEKGSIDLSVYSPPFADLFTYSSTQRDLGNSRDWGEFFNHYKYIIKELLRVTKKGRNTCAHTSDIPAMSMKDGYIGIRDFPGAVIEAYEKEGWIFYGRAIVTKNPQAQAIRTKSKALLFTQLRKNSIDSRPALLDHILIFKKPGTPEVPVTPVKNGEIDNEKWIDWAGGIWTGIQESDTLRYSSARAEDDEKHICPLQLGTIERCIKLYSNPGETVLTPFGGIGSEGYQAIKFGRKAILIELKKSYFDILVQNCLRAENSGQMNMFATGGE